MIVARWLSIRIFFSKLSKMGYGLNMKELIVSVYGGLRGAVGISFAMIANADPFIR